VLGYASLSHGEKSGGVNLTVGAAPRLGTDSLLVGTERANNAELGVKSTLLDGRLQLNSNLFWTEVHGYQANVYDQINRVQYLANAGSVRSRGLEFEATALPVRGLTLNFNGSWNDVRYTEYNDAPCPPEVSLASATATCDLSGHQVVGASKYIANLNGQYKWQLASGSNPTSPPATPSARKRWAPSTTPTTGRSPATASSTSPPACAWTRATACSTCRCG
jgi:iron complex outermembrane receptor protein